MVALGSRSTALVSLMQADSDRGQRAHVHPGRRIAGPVLQVPDRHSDAARANLEGA